MNNESIENLRVDNRLRRRRGWISDADLQKALDALPDVSDKILQPDEEEASEADAAAAETAETASNAEAPSHEVSSPTLPEGGGV